MPDCFILMPITTPNSQLAEYANDGDHFKHVQDYLFLPAIKKAGFNPVSPIAEGADIIHAEIIKNLEKADLVFCDISTSNPNVFFELGIRTALNKPVCIVKDNLTQKVPFDTTIINYHEYLSSLGTWNIQEQIDKLVAHIEKSYERSGGINMMWKYFAPSSRGETITSTKNNRRLNKKIEKMVMTGSDQKESEPVTMKQPTKNEKLLTRINLIALKYGAIITGSKLVSNNLLQVLIKSGALSRNARQKMMEEARDSDVNLQIIQDDYSNIGKSEKKN
jgi:hypothetical protein